MQNGYLKDIHIVYLFLLPYLHLFLSLLISLYVVLNIEVYRKIALSKEIQRDRKKGMKKD